MAKKPNFANEIDSIANSVEADVDRVINLLRDGNSPKTRDIDRSQPHLDRKRRQKTNADNDDKTVQNPQFQIQSSRRQGVKEFPRNERILENVTTRLTRETNQRLTEAALRQRLAKVTPDSRQAIIETAIANWLSQNGYA